MDRFVDFETRSEVDLQSRGASVYARDPSTLVLCMAYCRYGEQPRLWKPGDTVPPALQNIDKGDTFHAHNASFEIEIWGNILGNIHGFDVPDISQWQCTAARAAAASLPRSLDKASQALGLTEFKDKEGHRIMLKMCKPRKPTKNNPDRWHDKPEDYRKLYDYCKQDVVVEMAIHANTPPLSEKEQELWQLDWKINNTGVPVDLTLVESSIAAYEDYTEELIEELGKMTEGFVTTGGQTEKMLVWLAERGVNISNMRAATVVEQLSELDPESEQYRLLYIRKQLSRSSIKKFSAMLARSNKNAEGTRGRVRGSHLYCGADRTGRWAGMGIQPQNFPRGILGPEDVCPAADAVIEGRLDEASLIWGDKPDLLASMIRPAIAAELNHTLLVSDFAGIEARVLSWVAKQKDVMEMFRQGQDVYKVLASDIFKVDTKEVTSEQRFVGKVAVLGLGYGMGATKFQNTCTSFGRDIGEELAQKVVKIYRSTHKDIVRWWYRLEDMAILAIQDPNTIYAANNVKFCKVGRWLEVRLPSGRPLMYFDANVEKEMGPFGMKDNMTYMGVNSTTKQWEKQRTYGGKLAENIVQGIARDLLAEALTRVNRAGYKIVLHVHDEIVAEQPVGIGTMDDFEDIMREVPAWATDCPIDVEGFSTTRYRK